MNDDYKRGLVTGIAMHPLEVAVEKKTVTSSDIVYCTVSDTTIPNNEIVIPAQSDLASVVRAVASAFSAASGLTADSDNTFWLVQGVLGFKVYAYNAYTARFVIIYGGGNENSLLSFSTNSEYSLCYGAAHNGALFAFGFYYSSATAANKTLRTFIDTDANGDKQIIDISANRVFNLYRADYTRLNVQNINTAKQSDIQYATLIKLPTAIQKASSIGLFWIYFFPKEYSDITVDTALQDEQGAVYKIAYYNNYGLIMAFRVA